MQTLDEKSFKDKYGLIGTSQFADVEKQESLFSSIKRDLAERGQRNTDILNQPSGGFGEDVTRGFEVAANTAGGVGAVAGETLKRIPVVGGLVEKAGAAIGKGFNAVTDKLGGTKLFGEAAAGLEPGNALEKGLRVGQASAEIAGNALIGDVGMAGLRQTARTASDASSRTATMAKGVADKTGGVSAYAKGALRDVIPTQQRLIDSNLAKALDLTPGDLKNIEASTGNPVGKWMADNNLIGTNKVNTEGLIEGFFKTNYDGVRGEIAKVATPYKAASVPRFTDSLKTLAAESQGKLGLETMNREVMNLLKKEDVKLMDVQRVKELLDEHFNLYKVTGDVKEGLEKQGLANVRQELRTFIEAEVKRETGADIRMMNKNVATSRTLADAIKARDPRGLTRANLSWRDAMVGLGVYAFSTPVLGLAAVLAYKLGTSPTARLRFARWLDQRSDAQKAKINEAFKKGEVPKEVQELLELDIGSLPKAGGGIPKTRQTLSATIKGNEQNTNLVNSGSRGLFGRIADSAKARLDEASKNGERGFIKNPFAGQYAGEKDLTSIILDKLEGKTTVSKTFISDLTNMPQLKQAERDLVRNLLKDQPDTVSVPDFANRVKTELLPLKAVDRESSGGGGSRNVGRYEHIALPDELRGEIESYGERLYTSPIKTSAGDVHYSGQQGLDNNYFAHSRVEELPDAKTRRVIEIQSDLFQKGRLEDDWKQLPEYRKAIRQIEEEDLPLYNAGKMTADEHGQRIVDLGEKFKNDPTRAKLEPYRNTWHERVIREEVKQAAKDGKTKLQFPTGETAMKIEGLGHSENIWRYAGQGGNHEEALEIANLKVGESIWTRGNNSDNWIITDVLGDGKFKAVSKDVLYSPESVEGLLSFKSEGWTKITTPKGLQYYKPANAESFDISGKVDTNNPIYKFYEKEVGRYLSNNFKAKRITDSQGIDWWEVPVPKEMKDRPIGAFSGMGENVPYEQ